MFFEVMFVVIDEVWSELGIEVGDGYIVCKLMILSL